MKARGSKNSAAQPQGATQMSKAVAPQEKKERVDLNKVGNANDRLNQHAAKPEGGKVNPRKPANQNSGKTK